MSATGTLTITGAREAAAAALAPVLDTDPAVLINLVDSLDPPAIMLGWAEPWLEPSGTCRYVARLQVLCVAARLEPGEGVADLEELVAYAIGRLRADPYSWGLPDVSAPAPWAIGNLDYLAAALVYGVHVTTEED